MNTLIFQRMDMAARRSTPLAIILFLVLLAMVPVHIPEFGRIVPMLPLMAVFHWTIFRPDLISPVSVFIIGLLHDLLMGLPVGVTALVFLGVYGGVLAQRQFFLDKSFFIIWLGFALVAAIAALATWALISAYFIKLLEPNPALYQYLVTVGVYPLLSWICLHWQRRILVRV